MGKRIQSIEKIRGLAMLGVVGIHTGAAMLSNPTPNIHLFALFEICSRFSVPIFFFISAFGLYYQPEGILPDQRISKKRIMSVLVPYLSWSVLYMLYYSFAHSDFSIWKEPTVWQYFAFGLGSYQLYFLVILLVFLLLTPVWRLLVLYVIQKPIWRLSGLLLLQIGFNYYSSYILTTSFANPLVNILIQHRLSYWPLHYVWIFVLGAVAGLRYHQLRFALSKRRDAVTAAFGGTLIAMLGCYYAAITFWNFTLERTAFTFHQLSPMGILYTGATALFLMLAFDQPAGLRLLDTLGKHSFFVFLVHPFVMTGLTSLIESYSLIMTARVTLAFFCGTVAISLLLAAVFEKVSKLAPLLALLFTGKHPRRATPLP